MNNRQVMITIKLFFDVTFLASVYFIGFVGHTIGTSM